MRNQENALSLDNSIISGPILPASLKLAIPVLIGHLLNYTYAVVDTLFISMLDKDSTSIISGIGLIFPVFLLIIALGTGIFAGTSSVLARIIGEGRGDLSKKVANSSFFLAVGVAFVVLAVYLIWSDNIITLLAGDRLSDSAIGYGQEYLTYFLPGMLLLLIFFSLAGLAQGAGLVQYFAMAMMLSTVCNIILDPICIFTLDLGVKGAAIASSISIAVSLLFLFKKIFSHKSSLNFALNASLVEKSYLLEIVRIAVPQVLTLGVVSVGVMIFNFMVGSVAEIYMNSWVLVGRMDEILLIFGYAMSNATLTQIGQNYGSRNIDRVKGIYRTNIVIAILVGIGMAGIYNLFANVLFSSFSSLVVVVDNAVLQVRITSFSFIGIQVLLVSNAMFQATGRALNGLALNFIRIGIFILPIGYLQVFVFKSEIVYLFVTIAIANLLTLLISYGWSFFHLKNLKFKKLG